MQAHHQRALPIYGQVVEVTSPTTGETRLVKPWKRQRGTARAAYALKRAEDMAKAEAGKETREGQVLRCLAAHWNATQTSCTALELLAWMRALGESVFDINGVRPRLTAMVASGLVTTRGKRRCRISGLTVHTWGVKER